MKKTIFTFLVVLLISSVAMAQNVKVIKWPELEAKFSTSSDTTYVINFWATWCKPCIKELPHFDNLEKTFSGSKIKVILVSLDFKRQYDSVLIPYLVKNKVQSEVWLIDEMDYNSWIDKVDNTWSGAIPSTLIYNNSKGTRGFYEREFTAEELNKTVKPFLP